ncbi:hypothetical protein [Deinococcus sp. Marseille-Q6407]|uniref:hypothetical protein n=1 Tax=Deinococcus sp. Marseille-Q6407 TaxID=2969223 RepID=UPI0021C0F8BF|nr:hypothetical protein [Deinococcus sp. Marseille-Q6407]
MNDSPPLRHTAVLTLTGWAAEHPKGLSLSGVSFKGPPGRAGQRLTVTGHPWSNTAGQLVRFQAPKGRIRGAGRRANGSQLYVVGRVLRLDRSLGIIQVSVWPDVPTVRPLKLTMHATSAVLTALCPEAFAAEVRGRLLPGGLLLAETAREVHAPRPPRHQRWGKRGNRPQAEVEQIDLLLAGLRSALAELDECGPLAPGLEAQVTGYRVQLQQLGYPREVQP